MSKKSGKILVAVVVAIVLICGAFSSKVPFLQDVFNDTEVTDSNGVHFIDVGQGDSILVKTEDADILIDAGPGINAGDLTSYLKEQEIETIDYFITTHPHEDHIGGADDVIYSFNVKNIIIPYIPESVIPTTKVFENMLDAIEERNVNVIQAESGAKYTFGENSFEILGPNDEYEDLNMLSVITRFTVGGKTFMFTGDTEKESEYDTLKKYSDLSADVLKVAHHGSSTSSSEKFVKAVSPDFAVISCGYDNSYGHPHDETTDLLEKLNIEYFRTDNDGNIVFSIENGELVVNKEVA
ncbi:MAG: MBL fold metallo-hydrolase [Clostridia bacterium]|nr:MBL fold metallo-hydrolase [Clostridia bacterium]